MKIKLQGSYSDILKHFFQNSLCNLRFYSPATCFGTSGPPKQNASDE